MDVPRRRSSATGVAVGFAVRGEKFRGGTRENERMGREPRAGKGKTKGETTGTDLVRRPREHAGTWLWDATTESGRVRARTVGEDVVVHGEDALPFVAKIDQIKRMENDTQVRLLWYYRPEEAMGGRRPFHGKNELFLSDHFDWCSHRCVDSKCKVHTLRQYQELPQVTDRDYFSRFVYKAKQKRFKPDRVPVYCLCEMPYNPDLDMVECDTCAEWYHMKCVGIREENLRLMDTFVCPLCRKEDAQSNKR